jgi:hypothetical protein
MTHQGLILVRPRLDAADASELARCEGIIRRGLAAFYPDGTVLQRIRDGRLYRASYRTFEEYCIERWKLSKTHVFRLIQDAMTAQALVRGTQELQFRWLASLSAEDQRTIWGDPVEQSGNQQPTAERIETLKTITDMRNAKQAAGRRRTRRQKPPTGRTVR